MNCVVDERAETIAGRERRLTNEILPEGWDDRKLFKSHSLFNETSMTIEKLCGRLLSTSHDTSLSTRIVIEKRFVSLQLLLGWSCDWQPWNLLRLYNLTGRIFNSIKWEFSCLQQWVSLMLNKERLIGTLAWGGEEKANYSLQSISLKTFMPCCCHILYHYCRHYLFIFPFDKRTQSQWSERFRRMFSTYNDVLENNFFFCSPRSMEKEENVSSLNGKLLFLEWCRVVFSALAKLSTNVWTYILVPFLLFYSCWCSHENVFRELLRIDHR